MTSAILGSSFTAAAAFTRVSRPRSRRHVTACRQAAGRLATMPSLRGWSVAYLQLRGDTRGAEVPVLGQPAVGLCGDPTCLLDCAADWAVHLVSAGVESGGFPLAGQDVGGGCAHWGLLQIRRASQDG